MSVEATPLLTPAQRKLVGFALGFAAICAIGWLLFLLLSGVARFISAFSGVIWPLAVAGILVMNVMLVSVTQRTAEIGLLKALGATSVGMPVPQITDALSKGVIDGCVIPWEVTTSLKVPELVSNHTEFSGDHALYTTTFVLAMNKPRYESLPDDLKKVIDANGGQSYGAWAGKTQAEADAPARKIAVDRGNNIITLDQAEVDRWKAVAQPVIDAWVKDVSAKGIDGQKLLDEARASIEQHSKA